MNKIVPLKSLLKYSYLFFLIIVSSTNLNAQNGTWTKKADLGGVARGGAVSFSIGSKGYIGCGYFSTSDFLNDFWEYDPATDSWSQKATYGGTPRKDAVGFAIGTKGYIGTGFDYFGTYQKDFWEYDQALNKWIQKADFAGGTRGQSIGFSIGTSGYIGGGQDYNGPHYDFWAFNPTTNTWTQKMDLVGGIDTRNSGSFSIGTKGYMYENFGTSFYEYDATTNSWLKKADFIGGPRHYSFGFSMGTKGYIGGGYGQSALNDFYEYNPSTNSWSQKANFQNARGTATAFSIGNKGYMSTGYNSTNYFNDFNEFVPSCSPNTWTGSTNTNWSTGSNWSCGTVPIPGANVVIPSVTNLPVLSSAITVGNVSLGGIININGQTLTINGNVSGTGVIKGSTTSSLIIGGNAGTLNFTTGYGTLLNLTLNSSSSATIGNALSIAGAGTLNINTGAALSTGGFLTIKSGSSGTARVTPVAGTISGNVIVERYIPARRAWRLLTAPVSAGNTIYKAWQNSGSSTPGAGTFITKPGGGSGLEDGSISLKTFNQSTQSFDNVISTNQNISNSTGSADNKGYFIFIRGDRTASNLSGNTTSATTLSSIGKLQTGTQKYSTSSVKGNFSLIGNPYASSVDFSSVTRNNINKRFYVWDPSLNQVGGYVLVDDVNNTGTYSVSPSSLQNNIIQSGQAFFVETTNAGPSSLVVNESTKSAVTNNIGFQKNESGKEVLKIDLYLNNGGSQIIADGTLAEFADNFSSAVTIEDASKLFNINENLSLLRQGHFLALERRPTIISNDTLFLNITSTTTRNYTLRFEPLNVNTNKKSAFLIDDFLKKTTPLTLTSVTQYNFSVNKGDASASSSRFKIIFKPTLSLTLKFTFIKASKTEKGVIINWTVENESGINTYEIERSANGKDFNKIGVVLAKGNSNNSDPYEFKDKDPLKGINYYRIKSNIKSEIIGYSSIVSVNNVLIADGFSIYPNPVTDKLLRIGIKNERKGTYTLQVLNNSGQLILSRAINFNGEDQTLVISLPITIVKGIYRIKISNEHILIDKQIFIN